MHHHDRDPLQKEADVGGAPDSTDSGVAEYEAQLAQRRYEEVDPSNRLVVGTLEQRSNDALVRLEEIPTQFADFQSKHVLVVTPEQQARVTALAHDCGNALTTKAKDKKHILRLVIKDITVERFRKRRAAALHVRWQGGACEDLEVTLPAKTPDRLRRGRRPRAGDAPRALRRAGPTEAVCVPAGPRREVRGQSRAPAAEHRPPGGGGRRWDDAQEYVSYQG